MARPPETVQSHPDTDAAVLLRGGRVSDPTRTVRAARVRRLRRGPTTAAVFSTAPAGTHPGRVAPQGDDQFARERDDADTPRAFARAEAPPVPLRERALGLPPDPVPGELNADRLQPGVAGPTDALLTVRFATVVRRWGKAQQPADLPPVAERTPDEAFVSSTDALVVATPFSCTNRPCASRRALQSPPPAAARRARRSAFRPARGAPRHGRSALALGRQRGARPVPDVGPPRGPVLTRQARAPRRHPAADLIDAAASGPGSRRSVRDSPGARLPARRSEPAPRAKRRAPHCTRAPASAPTSARRSDRSLPAARVDSLRCSPNPPPDCTPERRQRPMNPEAIATRFVTAHDARIRRQAQSSSPLCTARSTARRSPLATVRTHGRIPNPDVIASFHASHSTRTPRTTSVHLHSVQGGSLQSSQPPLALHTRGAYSHDPLIVSSWWK